MSRKGFTLIELLIVVAIIGILAAIAIPNFLQAQIRAKIAKVKAEQASQAMGFEAYRTDNNGYPICHNILAFGAVQIDNPHRVVMVRFQANTPGEHYSGYWPNMVTTPVAYLSKLPRDPFPTHYWGDGIIYNAVPAALPNAIRNYYTWVWPLGRRIYPDLTPVNADIYYMITSPGPDRRVSLGLEWVQNELALSGIYDPSNGTISAGNITRFGP